MRLTPTENDVKDDAASNRGTSDAFDMRLALVNRKTTIPVQECNHPSSMFFSFSTRGLYTERDTVNNLPTTQPPNRKATTFSFYFL